MFTPFGTKPIKAPAAPTEAAAPAPKPTRQGFSGFVPAKPAAPAPVEVKQEIEVIPFDFSQLPSFLRDKQ